MARTLLQNYKWNVTKFNFDLTENTWTSNYEMGDLFIEKCENSPNDCRFDFMR